MNAEDTINLVAIFIQDARNDEGEFETAEYAAGVVDALARQGEDILAHLDPPLGLQRWLSSHGLSLVPTHPTTPPAVWAAIDAEEEEEDPDEPETPRSIQVGDLVEYRTAPAGPRSESHIGSGQVVGIEGAGGIVVVDTGPGQPLMRLYPDDFIQLQLRPVDSSDTP